MSGGEGSTAGAGASPSRHVLTDALPVDEQVRRLAAGGEHTLADLAVSCGYFDQAHLAREFRSLAGCPPSQWLTEEFAEGARRLLD